MLLLLVPVLSSLYPSLIYNNTVLLLLDEPAWGLDPLNTYLLVSILSNHAKKYSRMVLITMEKPR